MELSWSTFVLEIINFLVLVWILKRFLYKPVMDVIARRRADIESTLADAKTAQDEADALKTQYEGRLAAWDTERKQAREELAQEMEHERARQQASLKTELEKQKEKAQVSEAHRQADFKRKAEEAALALGARFASRVLEQATGAETESRLIDLVIGELSGLSDERVAALRNNWATAPDAIVVTSAFPIHDEQKRKLEQVLATVTGLDLPIHFDLDQTLVAGVNIAFGAWVLGASIRDELKGFTELVHD